ncbi:MAG: DUF389 domain-containing protein [Acidobacteria bacterium]|nr:DUF389 domain-containing protein [Acidobacteriota bacterium]
MRLKIAVLRSFALRKGTDVDGTVESICKGVSLRGTNLWLLLTSSALASIGLDTNSSAVIIGAMLVSPLMSPILAVGLSVATWDWKLLGAAMRSLMVAVGLSLAVSAGYFWISPLGLVTDEIAARTVPTLLDVGIALFGGTAGIVAMSRLEKTNAIPGVAIATALMPPLCTAGYGLAKADATAFFGAFYLFFLNAVFISFATFVVVRLLRFPRHVEVDSRTTMRVRLLVLAFVIAVTIPSVYLLIRVVERQRIDRNIQRFVRAEVDTDVRTTLRWTVRADVVPAQLQVYVAGEPIEPDILAEVRHQLVNYGLEGFELKVIDAGLSQSARKAMIGEVQSDLELRLEAIAQAQRDERLARDEEARRAKETLRRIGGDPEEIEALRGEIAAAFPEIDRALYAPSVSDLSTEKEKSEVVPARVVFVSFARGTSRSQQARLRARLASYLEERLKVRPVAVVDEPKVAVTASTN